MKKETSTPKARKTPVKGKKSNIIIANAIVFVINFVAIIAIYLGMIFLNGSEADQKSFVEYFRQNAHNFWCLVVATFLILSMITYSIGIRRKEFADANNTEAFFLSMEITILISYFIGKYGNVYLRPIPFIALISAQFFGKRNSIYISLVTCMIIFLTDTFTNSSLTTYEACMTLFSGFTTSVLAVYLIGELKERGEVLLMSMVLVAPNILCFLSLNEFKVADNLSGFICSCCSGTFSAILYLTFMPVFETLFKKATSFRLAELTMHTAPLLEKLREEAPGTFNHSLVVASLSESCASAIGEDPLLTKACAYYHDIGKLSAPEFFKENQTEKNSHDDILPELSASIIKAHAKDGYELLMKNRFPKEIADVCLEHHGTLPISYFLAKAKKYTDEAINLETYCYPGPKPQTKICAIIMICDGAEAVTRTLKDHSREAVSAAVQKIITERMNLGQFDDCPITMKDLTVIKHVLVNTLTGVYHKRIEYPKTDVQKLIDYCNGESGSNRIDS